MKGIKLTLGNQVIYIANSPESKSDYYMQQGIAESIRTFLRDYGGIIINGEPVLRSDPVDIEVKEYV